MAPKAAEKKGKKGGSKTVVSKKIPVSDIDKEFEQAIKDVDENRLNLSKQGYDKSIKYDKELIEEGNGSTVDSIMNLEIVAGNQQVIMERVIEEEKEGNEEDNVVEDAVDYSGDTEIRDEEDECEKDDNEEEAEVDEDEFALDNTVTAPTEPSSPIHTRARNNEKRKNEEKAAGKKPRLSPPRKVNVATSTLKKAMYKADATKQTEAVKASVSKVVQASGSGTELDEKAAQILAAMPPDQKSILERRVAVLDEIDDFAKAVGQSVSEQEADRMCAYVMRTRCEVASAFYYLDGLRDLAGFNVFKIEETLIKAIEKSQKLNKDLETQYNRQKKYNDSLYAQSVTAAQKALASQDKLLVEQPKEVSVPKNVASVRTTSLAELRKKELAAREKKGKDVSVLTVAAPKAVVRASPSVSKIGPSKTTVSTDLVVKDKQIKATGNEETEVEEADNKEEYIPIQEWDIGVFYSIINIDKKEVSCLLGLESDEVADDDVYGIFLLFSEEKWLDAMKDRKARIKLRTEVCNKISEQRNVKSAAVKVVKKAKTG